MLSRISYSEGQTMIDIRDMTIAIVDDAENMCKLMRSMLKSIGIGGTFFTGYNGRDALEIVRENDIDLLVMDWNMPVMNGFEALGHIREDEKLRDMMVVMVTGEADSEMVAAAAESDIDAYILKPLNKQALGDKIRAVVDRANNPPPMIVHLKAARAFKESGDFSGAMNELKLALEADPTSSKPLREMGILYFQKGDTASAEKCLLKASGMNRYDVFAFHYLGEIYLRRNDIDGAVRCFDKAMQVSPRNIIRGVNFGKALVKKGVLERATTVFDKALALSGDDILLQEEIANFCMENKAPDYAVRLFQTILKRKPGRTDIMMKLGLVLENTGAHLEAIQYFSEIEKKAPDNMEAMFHLAQNYLAVNQPFRADKVLRSILDKDPENVRAREILKTIT